MDHDRRAVSHPGSVLLQREDALSILFHAMTATIFLRLILECLRGNSPPIGNAEQ